MTPVTEPPATLPPNRDPPEGPSILLVKKTDGSSFGKTNPFDIRRALDLIVGRLKEVKPIRSGALLIETGNANQTATLLKTTKFMNVTVEVEYAERLNCTEAVVKSDQLIDCTNKELLSELTEQGVVRVQRLPSRNLAERGPNPTIKLSFKGKTIPQHIYCGYSKIRVDPWVRPPTQCRNCWAVGSHDTNRCRKRQPICGKCAQNHDTDSCEAAQPNFECCQCGGPHAAWNRRCPAQREAQDWHREEQKRARDDHRAKGEKAQAPQWPLREREWPTPVELFYQDWSPPNPPQRRHTPEWSPRAQGATGETQPANQKPTPGQKQRPGAHQTAGSTVTLADHHPVARSTPQTSAVEDKRQETQSKTDPPTPKNTGAIPKRVRKVNLSDSQGEAHLQTVSSLTETETEKTSTAHAHPAGTETAAQATTVESEAPDLEITVVDTTTAPSRRITRSRASSIASSRASSPVSRADTPPFSRHLNH